MNILYIGDIMGRPGIEVVRKVLPELKREHALDLIIAQSENVTEGRGMSKADFRELQRIGVDFFTGGNWTLYHKELEAYLADPQQPVIRPANYPADTPGRGWKYVQAKAGPVLVISLLGSIVGKDADKPVDNPLKAVDAILAENEATPRAATIVNFHGDYSSEKRVIGYYLDGRVTAVIGDHWHVPSADALVLPQGTAHISDVGMCGTLHSSLGVRLETIVARWRDGRVNRNELETSGPLQFNAVLIKTQVESKSAQSIQLLQKILP
jgi:hypothetical protein